MDLSFCYRLFARTNRFCALSTMNNKPPKAVSSRQTKSHGDSCQSPNGNDIVDQDDLNEDINEYCRCGRGRSCLSLTKLGSEQHQSRLRQASALKHITAELAPGKKSGDSHAKTLPSFDLSALVDSHCHLQLDPLGSFSQSAVDLALEMGVHRIMVCGTEPGDDWRRITELYQVYPDVVVPNFGLHPWWIKKYYASPGNRSGIFHQIWRVISLFKPHSSSSQLICLFYSICRTTACSMRPRELAAGAGEPTDSAPLSRSWGVRPGQRGGQGGALRLAGSRAA